jgi:hypothetical protein
MHNTCDCHCYDKDGKPLGTEAGKPSDAKKLCKKFGDDKQMAFMQTMFQAYAKTKKASKSKTCKMCEYGSSLIVNRKLGVMTWEFV